MKSLFPRKPSKDEREKLILIALVEMYLQTGRPVGSQALKDHGFNSLSPATLRNYFAKLEMQGLLKQHHSSGGRIPTGAAYKLYAEHIYPEAQADEPFRSQLLYSLEQETREVHLYLQQCAEIIADSSQAAVFLSAPRFDQDFISDIKLVGIDSSRILCVLISDFGTIRSEILFIDKKLSTFSLKRMERFFHWKLTGLNKPDLSEEEQKTSEKLYTEAMMRHIMNYSTFSLSDLFKTGFSKMLSYPDFQDASGLANGLSLFENDPILRSLLSECSESREIAIRIGEDLTEICPAAATCSTLIIPYYIHENPVGAIGLLCPMRVSYKKLFAILNTASEAISRSLTKSLYKFKISYRKPEVPLLDRKRQTLLLSQQGSFLLEDQTQGHHTL